MGKDMINIIDKKDCCGCRACEVQCPVNCIKMKADNEGFWYPEIKIQEIAQRCGYTDQHYFSYCFKKYCNESPNAMRRRLSAEKAGDQP